MCTYIYIYIYIYMYIYILSYAYHLIFITYIYTYTCFLFLILYFQRVQIRTPSFVSTPEFAGHCRCASWGKSMPGERQMSFQLEKSWLITIDAVFFQWVFPFFYRKNDWSLILGVPMGSKCWDASIWFKKQLICKNSACRRAGKRNEVSVVSTTISPDPRKLRFSYVPIWGCPRMGVPSNHPFVCGFSITNHPSGIPPFYGNPHF